MSHHIDSAKAREDGRLDLCDLYVFEGSAKGSTALLMTVNPFWKNDPPRRFIPKRCMSFRLIRIETR